MEEDFASVLRRCEELNSEQGSRIEATKPLSIVDPSLELLDPTPDIRELFVQFNKSYFIGMLADVEVKWSPRLTEYVFWYFKKNIVHKLTAILRVH